MANIKCLETYGISQGHAQRS